MKWKDHVYGSTATVGVFKCSVDCQAYGPLAGKYSGVVVVVYGDLNKEKRIMYFPYRAKGSTVKRNIERWLSAQARAIIKRLGT